MRQVSTKRTLGALRFSTLSAATAKAAALRQAEAKLLQVNREAARKCKLSPLGWPPFPCAQFVGSLQAMAADGSACIGNYKRLRR